MTGADPSDGGTAPAKTGGRANWGPAPRQTGGRALAGACGCCRTAGGCSLTGADPSDGGTAPAKTGGRAMAGACGCCRTAGAACSLSMTRAGRAQTPTGRGTAEVGPESDSEGPRLSSWRSFCTMPNRCCTKPGDFGRCCTKPGDFGHAGPASGPSESGLRSATGCAVGPSGHSDPSGPSDSEFGHAGPPGPSESGLRSASGSPLDRAAQCLGLQAFGVTPGGGPRAERRPCSCLAAAAQLSEIGRPPREQREIHRFHNRNLFF